MDDLIVSRLAPDRFLLVVNAAAYAKDVALMNAIARHLALADARLDPCAEAWAMLAVQGPRWVEVCRPVLGAGGWSALPPMKVTRLEFEGRELILSTTGYTGEPGMELLCPPELAAALWNGFVSHGANPAGLAARDTLRLEKGYALSGQDFTELNNPFEAGLGWVVDLDKPDFSGREALLRIKGQGVRRHLVGLLPAGNRIPRHGVSVVVEGRPVGEVTSGGFAPSLRRPVALAYVQAHFARPGGEVEIDLGNTLVKAAVTRRSFYPPPQTPESGE
jgi:aminomethyltransferase